MENTQKDKDSSLEVVAVDTEDDLPISKADPQTTKDALVEALQPLAQRLGTLEKRLSRFDERLKVVEELSLRNRNEVDSLQKRGAMAIEALDHGRKFPCPVCGMPNEFRPLPGESDESAKSRVCCHRCGITMNDPERIRRAKERWNRG